MNEHFLPPLGPECNRLHEWILRMEAPARGIHRRLETEVTESLVERFWSKVDRESTPDGCWPWTGALRGGYGAVKIAGSVHSSHCVAFVIANGEIPSGAIITHSCDNRPCCNPSHLSAGTAKSNVQEMDERGRRNQAHGDRMPQSRLTPESVARIRKMLARGRSIMSLAKQFGVDRGTIRELAAGRTWKHVPETV